MFGITPLNNGNWRSTTQSPICLCLQVEMIFGELLEARTGLKQVKGDPCLPCPLQQLEWLKILLTH